VKLEHNDYTGFEYQPNLRILYTPLVDHTFWGSVGRAVRTPSRIEEDADITFGPRNVDPADPSRCLTNGFPSLCTYVRAVGSRDFESEELLAGQIGWRAQLLRRLFVDTVAFYHDYDRLLSARVGDPFIEPMPAPPHAVVPALLGNDQGGVAYGLTFAADSYVTDWWRLQGWYTFLQVDLEGRAAQDGSTPQNQVLVFSQFQLPRNVELDTVFRYIDSLPALDIRSYVTFDVRVAYHVTPQLEIALVGQDLWDTDHREFSGGTEVERSGYAQVRWRW
jgi:iron complex outermembrane receptor protein